MLIICRAILEASGYHVCTARDGKTGLKALKLYAIDIAVIDNQMPGITGTELAREIKREDKNLPVLNQRLWPKACRGGNRFLVQQEERPPRSL